MLMQALCVAAAAVLCAGCAEALGGPERTAAPDFGPNVHIFDPTTPDIQATLDRIYAEQERAEFGTNRVALLFKPGDYTLDVRVGFYTHVIGLGQSPDDVRITGGMRVTAGWNKGDATKNFWRSAENMSLTPTVQGRVNTWAVAQGTALRRVRVKGDLLLSDGGWSSGGYTADCVVEGRINSGSQQQWFTRNSELGGWDGGVWNMVFVGVKNPPAGEWPKKPYTVIEQAPLVREKPYLTIDGAGEFAVMLPRVESEGVNGVSWTGRERSRRIPISDFHIARADRDTAATMNKTLAAGKHLLLTPGIYTLNGPINVTQAGAVVLGIGYPTLIPQRGTEAFIIGDVDGATLAGVMIDAGEQESEALVRVGDAGAKASHASDPVFLQDVFCRAGGASAGNTRAFVVINSNNVVGDNLWLWRADHGTGATWTASRNASGLIVNGNDVSVYALFVEHCQEYQTLWNGERGRVWFYQSEMPYDPPSQEAWSHGGPSEIVRGYASYKVADHVKEHEAWGLGVYCVFRGGVVLADRAIETPEVPGVKLRHMIGVRLEGLPESGIIHVHNKKGGPLISTHTSILE